MGLRGRWVLSHAPWLWLYVTAALVAAANVAMSQRAYDLAGEFGGFTILAWVVGMFFGQVSLAALWAAWGPATWVTNYALAMGSLCLLVALSCIAVFRDNDDVPGIVLIFEMLTATVVFTVSLVLLHLVRRFGGWRLQERGRAAQDRRWQISLRGMLMATAIAAVLLGLVRWWIQNQNIATSLRQAGELALATGMFSLLIETALVAPWFLFFAVAHPRRWVSYVALAVMFGYVLPFVIFVLFANGLDDALTSAYPLLPVQGGALTAGGLGLGMLHAAGVRLSPQSQ